MTARIDINADLGEDPLAEARDIALMAHISSCNIACGGHAGDSGSMARMLRAARDAGVAAGAHPSYPDRAGFGRTSLDMPLPALIDSLIAQVTELARVAADLGVALTHIKPHGMLYNDLADRVEMAEAVADALHRAFPRLALVGLAHGVFESAAAKAGARFIAEGFVDRGYTPTRRLVPRSQPGALIAGDDARAAQALAIATGQPLTADDGGLIHVMAQSLCLHSDSPGSEQTALRIAEVMASKGISIKAPGEPPDDPADLLRR
ncbi:MAG: 5-oxoprolinase subunit PxpA [Blastomonas fulva]|uniref:5-oxoprolinase subunit PxpA n=1 Tax=Blastomonas fulva TaxID=1550728 RepID=UPI0024E1C816|nr:5-oxoprolinase subunit PxpA [Blastomonas fulva]MDK2759511.1 5-oxoprolinase subunit PxpA [Blastomonas fulva]